MLLTLPGRIEVRAPQFHHDLGARILCDEGAQGAELTPPDPDHPPATTQVPLAPDASRSVPGVTGPEPHPHQAAPPPCSLDESFTAPNGRCA